METPLRPTPLSPTSGRTTALRWLARPSELLLWVRTAVVALERRRTATAAKLSSRTARPRTAADKRLAGCLPVPSGPPATATLRSRLAESAQFLAGAQGADLDAVPVAQGHVAEARACSSASPSSSATKASIAAAIATSAARALLPSSILIATPSPRSGKGGAEHALGADLAEDALAEALHHPGVEAAGAADHERMRGRPRRAAAGAAFAWSASRPTPVPTRAKACARWRSGIA